MKLSIVIPAYNESKLLAECLASIRGAVTTCARPGLEIETIVCDNNSTDATPRIARETGARVVFEPVNRISLARNKGASAAAGDWLLFIDADSRLEARTLDAMLRAAESGRYAGGGAPIDLQPRPWWGGLMVGSWSLVSRTLKWAAGSFIFCRADAFRETGGFPPDMAVAEELALSIELSRWASAHGLEFVILTNVCHVSSGRKFYLYSLWEFLSVVWRLILSPRRSIRDTSVNKIFYDGRR